MKHQGKFVLGANTKPFDSLAGGDKEYKRGKNIQDTLKHIIQIHMS